MASHRRQVHPIRTTRSVASSTLLAWVVCAVTLVLVALGAILGLPSTRDEVTIVTTLAGSLAAASLAIVGAVLVTRVPRNPIGWLLWASGFFFSAADGLSTLPTGAGPAMAWVPWVAWLGNLCWVPALVLVGLFVPLVFPTGRLPSPHWRLVVALAFAALAASELQAAFSPFPPGSAPAGVVNPLAVGGTAASLLNLGSAAATLTGVVCFPLAAGSLVLRYRHAAGAERAQLRWFAASVALVGVALAIALPLGNPTGGIQLAISNVAWFLLMGGLALLPVAIAVAVLRYRLYEIDRLVSRTIAYGLVTVTLLAVYGGAILALQPLLAPVTRSNDIAVAGSTLLVAALFQPLRRRLQQFVDRRFNRSRYDAERTVAAFGERLRDEVDLGAVGSELMAAVAETVEPISVSLWLR
jgi:hypothetical protein